MRLSQIFQGLAQSDMWQEWSYGAIVLAAIGVAAGWALLFALKLGLGFAVKRIAYLYVRHYDERHAKSRCVLCS